MTFSIPTRDFSLLQLDSRRFAFRGKRPRTMRNALRQPRLLISANVNTDFAHQNPRSRSSESESTIRARLKLLGAERDDRVDLGRLAGGEVAGQQGDGCEQHR